jgi:hypothetical protein
MAACSRGKSQAKAIGEIAASTISKTTPFKVIGIQKVRLYGQQANPEVRSHAVSPAPPLKIHGGAGTDSLELDIPCCGGSSPTEAGAHQSRR